MNNRQFVITKRIAKHGKQSVIIVPTLLQDKLPPGTLAQVSIEIIERDTEKKQLKTPFSISN